MTLLRWGSLTTFVLFTLDLIGVLSLTWWQIFAPFLGALLLTIIFIIGIIALVDD